MRIRNSRAIAAVLIASGLAATACGSSSSSSSTTTAAPSGGASTTTAASSSTTAASSSTTASSPPTTALATTTASSFTNDFSAMAALKPIATAGTGKIAVILPDTTSSARYTEFDAPYLAQAFEAAGLPKSDFIIQNAAGSDATALSDAESDITGGAKVIAIDPEDPAGGTAVANYAKAHGAQVIDYDRLTIGSYYVSFNNVQVGTLIGQGLVSCVDAWHIAKPQVIVMHGDATDNNATLFAQGYNAVMAPYFSTGKWTRLAQTADTWKPPLALSEFQAAFNNHKNANSALIPNDETGAPIIAYLQSQGVKAKTFATTGQDATLIGLQNVIAGYQCGTAYKPIYEEAQAAAAIALYLRAGKTPPHGLVNGATMDPNTHQPVPSVLLTPKWVTASNMQSTIITDKFVPASQLCAGKYATYCKQYGIH